MPSRCQPKLLSRSELSSLVNSSLRRVHRHCLSPHRSFSTPPHLQRKIRLAMSSAWAPSTRRLYNNSISRFLAFCSSLEVPLSDCFPASEEILCAFAASSLGSRSSSSVRNDLSGIRAWHLFHNAPYNGSARLSLLIRGIDSHAPASAKRNPRPPVTSSMIAALFNALSPADPLDVACFATATCAFWGQARLGELLSNESSPSLRPSIPTRKNLLPLSSSGASRTLHLPWTKTSRSKGEDIVLCRQHFNVDPLAALSAHLSINSPPNDLPLFSFAYGNQFRALSRSKFLARCNAVWGPLGFPTISGHCFRIGGTTELLVRGVPPDIVKSLGRWTSDSFLRYWRSLEDIATRHIAISSSAPASVGVVGLPGGCASSSAPSSPRVGRIRLRLPAHPRLGLRPPTNSRVRSRSDSHPLSGRELH